MFLWYFSVKHSSHGFTNRILPGYFARSERTSFKMTLGLPRPRPPLTLMTLSLRGHFVCLVKVVISPNKGDLGTPGKDFSSSTLMTASPPTPSTRTATFFVDLSFCLCSTVIRQFCHLFTVKTISGWWADGLAADECCFSSSLNTCQREWRLWYFWNAFALDVLFEGDLMVS